MSTSDLLSSTLNWPGKGLYGLKSSVLQTTENDLVKQTIVSDHMRNHYRRLHSARSAVDSKPPKAMILGQKCRDRARKEMAQMAYTQNLLNEFSGDTVQNTPRARSSHSMRAGRFAQSQPTTYRARSRSIESARMVTRSLTMNGSVQNLQQNDGGIANKLFGDGVFTQALTSMAALGKITSSARNKSSADVLDKHPESFSQPEPDEYQPRLVKRDGASYLRNNRAYYNPPTKTKSRPTNATKQKVNTEDISSNENKSKEDEQLALSIRRIREQLNRSMELRHNVEKKIKKAKATTTTNPPLKKQSDEALKRFGLTERERLQYVRFMQEVTDAIIRNNLTTEPAIEKLYEIHIDRNRETLDEHRLRGLLEALKEDLGVRTSRKADTYASVHKATSYDNEPLPPQTSVTKREDASMLTPHNDRQQLSYDINAPLPWESDNSSDRQLPRTQETKRNSLSTHAQNPLNDDDYLFSPSSTTIKPKPRLSLQTKTEDHYQAHDIPNTTTTEHESTIPMNFNSTIRTPMNDLLNTEWLSDAQPTKTTIEKSTLHNVQEHHDEEEADHDEQRSPSPQAHHRPESSTYGSNDFEEHDDSEQ